MSDIKLFDYSNGTAREIESKSADVEKSLQTLIEKNMETFLGVRFLAAEYSTGNRHRGRIDSLGVDENNCPVIVEYKRNVSESVINQGLFYLDWLLEHQGDFQILVQQKLGSEVAENIDWSVPRLLCVASDFTRYDKHAVQQIDRHIELIRYRFYDEHFLLFEQVNVPVEAKKKEQSVVCKPEKQACVIAESAMPLFDALQDAILAFDDSIQVNHLRWYVAFKKIKNFVCVGKTSDSATSLVLFLKVDPKTVKLEEGFTRDVTGVGHWGTGDLRVDIRSVDDIEKAKPLLRSSFERS